MFTFPVRIYYEDTDAAGVVYYANYLRYCERARTEWLRATGFEQQQMKSELGLVFVVRAVTADYLAPAVLDDMLQVITQLETLGRASMTFLQTITRDDVCLFKARIVIACVDWDRKKATALPLTLRHQLQLHLSA